MSGSERDADHVRRLIDELELEPHDEGGWFREVFRSEQQGLERAATALIAFLLEAGQRSHWHRLDCLEIWHFYGGAPLSLYLSADGATLETVVLGGDLAAGQLPYAVVSAEVWMSAVSQGDYSLVGCQTAPAFEYAGFDLAPADWVPGKPLPEG